MDEIEQGEVELLSRIAETICLAIRQINKPVDDDLSVISALNRALMDCQSLLVGRIG